MSRSFPDPFPVSTIYWHALRLFTLGPLHIGTGETLSPLDYVVDGQTFYRLSQDEFYAVVRKVFPDNGTRLLADWISDQQAAMRDLSDNKQQAALSNKITPLEFFRQQGKANILLEYLRRRGDGQPLRLDDDNRFRKDKKFGDIREAIRTGIPAQPYLPGTSIKGAIRTALLYDFLLRHGDDIKVEQIVREQLNNRKVNRRGVYFAKPLEAAVFFADQKIGKRTRNDEAQMDLLKWLYVRDAADAAPTTLEPGVAKINIYLVEAERDRQRKTGRMLASKQKQASYAEIIPGGRELRSEIGFDATSMLWALGLAGDKGVSVKRDVQYIGLERQIVRLFNLKPELFSGADAGAMDAGKAVVDHCLKAVAQFSAAQLSRQREWLEDYAGQIDQNQYSNRIAAGYHPITNHNGSLLHLGYAAGFSATTALLYFLENTGRRELFEEVMLKFGLGQEPNAARKREKYFPKISRFPKSRRLAEDEDRIQPLGWMALLPAEAALPKLEFPTVRGIVGTASSTATAPSAPPEPVKPEYFTGKFNFKRPPELDAVVVKTGRPNMVKVYYTPDNSPVLKLDAYRNTLDVGTVIRVAVQATKKGVLLAAAYRGVK